MDTIERVLIIVAAAVVIIGGAIYIESHSTSACVDLFFWEGCGVAIKP